MLTIGVIIHASWTVASQQLVRMGASARTSIWRIAAAVVFVVTVLISGGLFNAHSRIPGDGLDRRARRLRLRAYEVLREQVCQRHMSSPAGCSVGV